MKKPALLTKTNWLVPAITGTIILVFAISFLLVARYSQPKIIGTNKQETTQVIVSVNIDLPAPDLRSSNSIEAVLRTHQSKLTFVDTGLTLKQAAQLLWSAQGVTTDWGGRTTASAKSTYPLSVYLVANKIDGLDQGQYQYIPGDLKPIHQLKPIKKADLGKSLFELTNQSPFKDAPAIFIITGDMSKMAEAYGGTPHDREVYLEAGLAAENMYLQAESLKLGMVSISNFDDFSLRGLVTIPDSETIIYLIPVGVPKQ